MGILPLHGRTFTESDRAATAPVAVVSSSMAARYWQRGAVGQRLKLSPPDVDAPWIEVVGVVGEVSHRGLQTQRYDLYVPQLQSPWKLNSPVIRTRGEATTLLPEIRSRIATVDRSIEPLEVATGEQLVGRRIAHERFRGVLITLFAVLAVSVRNRYLRCGGLSARGEPPRAGSSVGPRRRPSQLLREILRASMVPAATGIALGLLPALLLEATLVRRAIGTPPVRASDVAIVVFLLLAVSFAACYGPARRASRLNPGACLRGD